MSENKKAFLLCISGISTAGKSRISSYLKNKYGFNIIHLDNYLVDYFKLPKYDFKGITEINYELPETINWDLFISTLQHLNPNKKYIIDGFIPFSSPKVAQFVDCLIDIEFDINEYEEALRRRVKRDTKLNVPDDYEQNPLKSTAHYTAFYFKNFVWKEAFLHPEYRVPLNWSKPILKLSATSPFKQNCKKSQEFISKFI